MINLKLAGVIAVFSAGVIATLWITIGDKIKAEERMKQAQGAARLNQASLEVCLLDNESNALEAAIQRANAERAEARAKTLTEAANSRVETINREVDTYRTEMDCPALTADFAEWVRD